MSPMKTDPTKLAKAEQFADRMEAQMRDLGATGDYFCDEQRKRWRQHSIRAYLGTSSTSPTKNPKDSEEGKG
jgi:hypothetical protein